MIKSYEAIHKDMKTLLEYKNRMADDGELCMQQLRILKAEYEKNQLAVN